MAFNQGDVSFQENYTFQLQDNYPISQQIYSQNQQLSNIQDIQNQDNEILQSYLKVRDSIGQFDKHHNQYFNQNENEQLYFNDEMSAEQKLEYISNIENPKVSQMLMQRIREREQQQQNQANQSKQFSQVPQLTISNQGKAYSTPISHKNLHQQHHLDATCSTQLSNEKRNNRSRQVFNQKQPKPSDQFPLTDRSQIENNQARSQNYDPKIYQKSLNQSNLIRDQPNLSVYEFALASTPQKRNTRNMQYNLNTNLNKHLQQSSIKRQPEINKKFSENKLKENENYIQKYIQDLNKHKVTKYSQSQAKKSGQRMYTKFEFYQQRLKQKKIERENEMMSEIKQKPSICKKSDVMASNSINQDQSIISSRRHSNCYYKNSEVNQSNERQYPLTSRTNIQSENQLQENFCQKLQQSQRNLSEQKSQSNVRFITPNQKPKSILKQQTGQQQVCQRPQSNVREIQKQPLQNAIADKQNTDVNQNTTNIHQHKKSQSDELLRKLSQQYNLNHTNYQEMNKINKENDVVNMSDFMKQIKNQQQQNPNLHNKIIEQILNSSKIYQSKKSDEIKVVLRKKPEPTKLGKPKNLNVKKIKKRGNEQSSLISQIKNKTTEQDNNKSYFNVHSKYSRQENKIKTIQSQEPDKQFKQMLRNNHQERTPSKKIQNSKSPAQNNVKQNKKIKQLDWRNVPVYERNMLWKYAKEKDMLDQRLQKEDCELQDCNFTPRISEYNRQNESQTQKSSSHSPLLSQRQNLNYQQLFDNRQMYKQVNQQKYPYQVKLRVQERGSNYCSSQECSATKQRQSKISSLDQSPVKSTSFTNQTYSQEQSQSQIEPHQANGYNQNSTSLRSLASQYLDQNNPESCSMRSKTPIIKQEYDLSINEIEGEVIDSVRPLPQGEPTKRKLNYNQNKRSNTSARTSLGSDFYQNTNRGSNHEEMEFTLMNSLKDKPSNEATLEYQYNLQRERDDPLNKVRFLKNYK